MLRGVFTGKVSTSRRERWKTRWYDFSSVAKSHRDMYYTINEFARMFIPYNCGWFVYQFLLVSPNTEIFETTIRTNLKEVETQLLRQGGHVSTMRVFLVDERYITIRAPLHFACSLQAVLEFA